MNNNLFTIKDNTVMHTLENYVIECATLRNDLDLYGSITCEMSKRLSSVREFKMSEDGREYDEGYYDGLLYAITMLENHPRFINSGLLSHADVDELLEKLDNEKEKLSGTDTIEE